jgi:hypothetical protein
MTSFYINRLNSNTTEMDVTELFSEFGKVDQVEFILPNTKHGLKENNDSKSALIHISDLTQKGLYVVHHISDGEDYKLYFKSGEIWSVSCIQNILMNNSENCSYLEKKVEAQGNTIEGLLGRLHNTERRIEELEIIVNKLINYTFEEDDSVSTHSSMPSLVDDESVSTHSSMPSLVDDETVSTHSSMPSLDEDDEDEDDEDEDDDEDDNSTQSSLTWLEDDFSNSSVPPLIDEYGNIVE